MSRLGKLPIALTQGTQAKIENDFVVIKGPKGELKQQLHPQVKVEITDTEIVVSIDDKEDGKKKALWGLYRSLLNNMVIGVTKGYERKLEVNGVGFKVSASGNKLNLALGFSHPVVFELPAGISAKVEGNAITLSGIDKQLIGEMAAQIRGLKKPEPYKGKGIKYAEETIVRKAGKTAGK